MSNALKTFLAANKTSIVLGATALVFGAKSLSLWAGMNDQGMVQPTGIHQPDSGNDNSYNQQAPAQRTNQDGYENSYEQNSAYYGNDGYNSQGGYSNGSNNGSYYTGGNAGADYTSGWYAQQNAYDKKADQFSDYLLDQGNYTDGNGNEYKMSSNYNNNWVNTTTNEAIQSNDPGYDPNQYSSGSWTSVTPSDYSAGSSYSTSSYSSTSSGDE